MDTIGKCAKCGENLTSNHICSTYPSDPHFLTNPPLGKKFDQGKLRMDLLPAKSIKELAKVITYGAEKYGDNNWQNVETKRYVAAMFRHIFEWMLGEKYDEESGLHHLSHALCNAAFIVYKEVNYDVKKISTCKDPKDIGAWDYNE